MGRIFPRVEKLTSAPSIVSISLLIACIVATFVVVSSLCGLSRRKQSSSEKKCDEPVNLQINTTTEDTNLKKKSVQLLSERPRSPPKLKHARASSYHFQTNSSASFGKSRSSTSMRLQGGMNSLRQYSVREDRFKKWKEKTFEHEDSIWKKQIILGEKCKVPDEDDDTILYDEKGKRYLTYHPKQPSTLPSLSRQCSTHEISN